MKQAIKDTRTNEHRCTSGIVFDNPYEDSRCWRSALPYTGSTYLAELVRWNDNWGSWYEIKVYSATFFNNKRVCLGNLDETRAIERFELFIFRANRIVDKKIEAIENGEFSLFDC